MYYRLSMAFIFVSKMMGKSDPMHSKNFTFASFFVKSSPVFHEQFSLKQVAVLNVALIIFGFLLAVAGMVGCILPIIPGPILSFFALILLSWVKNWQIFSPTFLIVMGILTGLLTLLDVIAPALGAKKYGASKRGLWGSAIGMIIGIFFIPPWGMIVGAFIGALLGELASGKSSRKALRAGWGILIGNVFGIGLKLAFTAVILFYYLKEMI